MTDVQEPEPFGSLFRHGVLIGASQAVVHIGCLHIRRVADLRDAVAPVLKVARV
ncbi:hypothetical protein [Benzoatithermus flavus]|uniref:Uncharacterized protein n=1 Tax=Benzoatithermus flavus TaxID=3108223 RepID=A0ABU8XPQ9_9PROT